MIVQWKSKIKKSDLLKSGITNTVGNILLKGITFLTIPIFTRLLTPSDYGTLNNFTALSAVSSVLIGLGLNSTLANAKYKLADKSEKTYSEYKSSILFLSLLIFIFFLFCSFILNDDISKYIGLEKNLLLLLSIDSYSLFLLSFYISDLNVNFKHKSIVKLNLIIAIVGTALAILFINIMDDRRYLGRIIGMILPNSLFSIYILYINFKKEKFIYNREFLKFGLSISIPLIPHILSGQILSQFDRIMIYNFVGDYQAGIYSFTYNVGMILAIIWSSINQVWVAWFYKQMNEKDYKKIHKISRYYIYLFTVFSIIMIYISPEIIKIMAPKAYWAGISILLPIVATGYFKFIYSLPVNVEFYLAKTKYISAGTIISAAINIILNLAFIPKYGYFAAAYTTLISYIFQFIFHYYIYTQIYIKPFSIQLFAFKDFLKSIFTMVIFSIIFLLTIEVVYIRYLILTILILIIIFHLYSVSNRKL